MKKIGKIQLNEISNADLAVFEMNRIFGGDGGSGTYDDPFQLPEVYVYGKYTGPCPACAAGYQWMVDANYHPFAITTGCAVLGIEHLFGCCGHR
jgi:natural product precursor